MSVHELRVSPDHLLDLLPQSVVFCLEDLEVGHNVIKKLFMALSEPDKMTGPDGEITISSIVAGFERFEPSTISEVASPDERNSGPFASAGEFLDNVVERLLARRTPVAFDALVVFALNLAAENGQLTPPLIVTCLGSALALHLVCTRGPASSSPALTSAKETAPALPAPRTTEQTSLPAGPVEGAVAAPITVATDGPTHTAAPSASDMTASRESRLVAHLVAAYSEAELKIFIASDPVLSSLNSQVKDGSQVALAWDFVGLLARCNLLDRVFFDRLIESRPRWRDVIVALRNEWFP